MRTHPSTSSAARARSAHPTAVLAAILIPLTLSACAERQFSLAAREDAARPVLERAASSSAAHHATGGTARLVPAPPSVALTPRVTLISTQTLENISYAQGITVRDAVAYVLADMDTGVIRPFTLSLDHADPTTPRLEPAGISIACTLAGNDVAPHPTGLTWAEDNAPATTTDQPLCFLGDTVRGVGTIFTIDWARARATGTLEDAILSITRDDAATNGTRPEAIELAGRTLIATSDYGDHENHLRLYDPAALARAARTTEPGVVVHAMPCGPFVQSIRWIAERNAFVLVQNTTPGLGYRLTFIDAVALADALHSLHEGEAFDLRGLASVDLPELTDELEGFTMLTDDLAVLVSASSTDNAHFVEINWPQYELRLR